MFIGILVKFTYIQQSTAIFCLAAQHYHIFTTTKPQFKLIKFLFTMSQTSLMPQCYKFNLVVYAKSLHLINTIFIFAAYL